MTNKTSARDLVSVIVPVYNIEDYLPRCLASLSSQTHQNIEIILVDDGSTDNSARICDAFIKTEPRAKVIHQENAQLWAARNAGKRNARGDYLMFVDGDDYLSPFFIESLLFVINDGDRFDIAMAGFKETTTFDDNSTVKCESLQTSILTKDEYLKRVVTISYGIEFTVVWNKLYRKELIDRIWAENYHRAQDYDFNIRVGLKTNKVIWVHNILYFYVKRPNSLSRSLTSQLEGRCYIATILYNNNNSLDAQDECYRYLLLKQLYITMIWLLNDAIATPCFASIKKQCNDYERHVRYRYWRDSHFGLVEKMAMTLNVRFPKGVDIIKKLTKGKFTWRIFRHF